MTTTALHIDASARKADSVTRKYTQKVLDRLNPQTVLTRDLAQTLPFIDEEWVGANFTPVDERTDQQKAKLALSDELIAELKAADVVVIGLPLYNFSLPASLKAWIDLIARAGVTFQYTESGPKGLLEGKRAIVVAASGGVPVGSPVDFATGYIRHVLGFVGITEVEIIAADQMAVDAEASIARLEADVQALAA
ncbi:FMN-dependent NADH-azoreductase [Actibacterium pelagium]|uniref:FMN dependent NADH:quinone oxidoreductase n=1 Tax=Actibacterium pelagium TaxID=2029103 RepID=A0A917AGS6_9RHOB|nr:NAD(P)H-dependent oxidoreductase [Actibacterium pelagium]GGE51714.1 FMN-dependent NADH-azoreductase [Actibacterium pelagium]